MILRGTALFAALCTSAAHATDWLYEQTLRPDAHGNGQHFGAAVAADRYPDGTIRALYVGVPYADVVAKGNTFAKAGRVDVLVPQGGWHVATTITHVANNNWQANAHFGASVAVHNGIIVIGAPDWDDNARGHAEVGAAVIFRDVDSGNPGQPVPNITLLHETTYSSAAGTGAHRGRSVAVDGDLTSGAFIAVGEPDYGGTGCADVYRLDLSDFVSQGFACGATAEEFGASVAIHADSGSFFHLIAGAPGKKQGSALLAGEASVYVPMSGNLALAGTLKAQAPAFLDAFGATVAITADHVYVGGTGRGGSPRTGSVSVFKPASVVGYDFEEELFPANGVGGELCGAAISVDSKDSSRLAVGCPGTDGLVAGEGFVRLYVLGNLFEDELSMSDLPHGADDMGRSVLLDADRVYAGAPLADDNGDTDSGVVRVFATDHIFSDDFEGP